MTVLAFGPYEFDPALPELREQGERVRLQVMPLRVLGVLLRRPGELVTRDEFFRELWPDDRSGILDDNLNTAVRKLRLALDDSAHRPRYIETVPRRGYRFVGRLASRPAGESAAAGPAKRDRHPATPWIVFLLFAALLASVVGSLLERSSTTAAPGSITTLAVLPFVNAGDDPEDRYFSEGLAEEIIDQLARTRGLRVVSRTSSFAVDAARLDAREIGRLLEADALVEGSVRRDGERLRISVRLVNSADGYQLWSESYDRNVEDAFAVQQDIAHSLAGSLTGSPEREARSPPAQRVDPVAYDHYLQGRFAWHRRSEDGLRTAARHFQLAVERAPDYARAWTGLADAYAVLGFYDYLPPIEAFPMARKAAEQALTLAPDDADAEATLGYTALYYDWNLAQAEDHFRRAIELRPDHSKAQQWYGNLLTAAGRFEEAEAALRRATQLDPLSLIASAALGWSRYFAGRYDEALEQLDLTRELDPGFELTYLWTGWVLEAKGELEAARDSLEEAVERSGGSGITTAALARTLALMGDAAEASRLLASLDGSDGYVPAYEIAKARFALGEHERAMALLERAYAERSHSLVFLRVDPQLADVQAAPDFAALAARVLP